MAAWAGSIAVLGSAVTLRHLVHDTLVHASVFPCTKCQPCMEYSHGVCEQDCDLAPLRSSELAAHPVIEIGASADSSPPALAGTLSAGGQPASPDSGRVGRIRSGINADLVDLSCMLSPSGSTVGSLAGASPEAGRDEVCKQCVCLHMRWPVCGQTFTMHVANPSWLADGSSAGHMHALCITGLPP